MGEERVGVWGQSMCFTHSLLPSSWVSPNDAVDVAGEKEGSDAVLASSDTRPPVFSIATVHKTKDDYPFFCSPPTLTKKQNRAVER
jgi:hypothetical protein